jgi:hypothetical protein
MQHWLRGFSYRENVQWWVGNGVYKDKFYSFVTRS